MTSIDQHKTPKLDALFLPQLEAFHATLDAKDDTPGNNWRIDSSIGMGYYWNYFVDDMMAVTICELEFFEELTFSYEVPDFFCVGKYDKNMSSYYYANPQQATSERVLGYARKRSVFKETVKKDMPLRTVSISLLPEAMHWLSGCFRVNPLTIASAISELDGKQIVPGLSELFDSLFSIRPCNIAARTYYESKILEACALLVDWKTLKHLETDPSIRPADHTALNVVLEYIHENIEKNITLGELCKLSCMSASKLSLLFRQTKHKSPIEYAKDVKMDYACRLLADDSASIYEISSRLGFMYQGSFSEAFKGRYGITPMRYRRTHKTQRTLSGTFARIKAVNESTPKEELRKEELSLRL